MDKLKSPHDLKERFCFKDGQLKHTGEHTCPRRAIWPNAGFRQCYEDFYPSYIDDDQNPTVKNWYSLTRRHEWSEDG